MGKTTKKKNKIIELNESRAMIMLPDDAIEIEIKATIYKDGKTQKVSKTLSNADIQKAFTDASENYIEDTDCFVVTDKGIKWLETLNNEIKTGG